MFWGVSNIFSLGQQSSDSPKTEQKQCVTPYRMQRRSHWRTRAGPRGGGWQSRAWGSQCLFFCLCCWHGNLQVFFPPFTFPLRHSFCFSPCFLKLCPHPFCIPSRSPRLPIISICSSEPRQDFLNVIWQQLHLDSPYTGLKNYNNWGDRLRGIITGKTKRAGCMEKAMSSKWATARNEWDGSGVGAFYGRRIGFRRIENYSLGLFLCLETKRG